MRIYLAGHVGNLWQKRNFYNFYHLDNFIDIPRDEPVHKYKDFMLDSGAFSFVYGKKPGELDWEKYADRYADFVREKQIKNYIELDIDKLIGLKEVERLRKRIEKRVGWKSMPVWHVNRGYEYWIKMCTDYDYVCFGAFLVDRADKKNYSFIIKFIRDASLLNAKVHGLGFTNFEWLPKLHFYSVDSTSWLAGNKFGFIFKYENGKCISINKRSSENCRLIRPDEAAWHNFQEWVKFSYYADIYL